MSAEVPAAEGLAERIAARERAQARVAELDAEQRASTLRAEAASEALVAFEREHPTGRATERAKLERELIEARAQQASPWAERRAGATARVRDADREIRAYASANLSALIEEVEADGRDVVARINELAAKLVAAYQERSAIEARLFSTLAMTGRAMNPSDVNRSRGADQVVTALSTLIREGGEVAPQVRVPELLGESAAA